MKKQLLPLIFLTAFFLNVKAQSKHDVDSLKHNVAVAKHDTIKIKALLALTNSLKNASFKEAFHSANEMLALSLKLKRTTDCILSYNAIADIYWYQSSFEKAQKMYFKVYLLSNSVKDKKLIALSLYNLGWIKAIDQKNKGGLVYLYKAKQIYEQTNDTIGLRKIYNAFGNYYEASFKSDLGNTKLFDSSVFYYQENISMAPKKQGYVATTFSNLSEIYFVKKEYTTALKYANTALDIFVKIENDFSINSCKIRVANCELNLNKLNSALIKFEAANKYATVNNNISLKHDATSGLARTYYELKNYKKAYEYNNEYLELSKKMDKERYSTELSSLTANFDLEKSETDVKQLKQAAELQKIKNTQSNYVFVFVAIMLVILSCVALLLLKQNKIKNKINDKLHVQNTIIAQKNEEIQSSIKYAKGIQQALLTSNDYITKHLQKDYFIYYEPKDIVSGDFYWAVAKHNLFYIAVADCTGHGVPGAFMSLLNINFLNENVIEQGIQLPNEILNEQRKEIIEALNPKGNENSKDGMDCVLCAINVKENKLQLSASNNPLWLVRNNELIEYKADKMPVGKYDDRAKDFTLQEIQLLKNDVLYMFTDGYADQFGGEKGKKFMSKQLRKTLLSIAHLPMAEQQQLLTTTFNNWKGNLEQVDDVCIMGIRI